MSRFPFKLQWLATGTGHCGTGYVASVLLALGIPCSHEGVVHHGGRIHENLPPDGDTWNNHKWRDLHADSSWGVSQAYFWSEEQRDCREELLKNVTLIHVVRNPLLVLESLQAERKMQRTAEAFLQRTERILAAPYPRVTYRVEDGPKKLAELVGRRCCQRAHGVPTNYNQHVRGPRRFTSLAQLTKEVDAETAEKLWLYARQHGYEAPA